MALQVFLELLVLNQARFQLESHTLGKIDICGLHLSDRTSHVRILQTSLRRSPASSG